MEIKFGNFNHFQNIPKQRITNPMSKLAPLKADTVSFSGNVSDDNKSVKDSIMDMLYGTDTLEKLVPKHKGIVYKKIKDANGKVIDKIPVEIDIVKTMPGEFQFQKDGEVIGTLELSYVSADKCGDDGVCFLHKNYKEEGIVGPRIIVNYVHNSKEEEYGGVAHLADLIEVAACKKIGFEPNVVSESFRNVTPLHYIRGKRFVPYEKYLSEYSLKKDKKNPNEIVEKIIATTPKGQKYDASELNPNFVMYMPKEMIKELEEELKEHPIF